MKSLLLIFLCFLLVFARLRGSGEVIFNEIMYDPTPELGLPAYEYIELYNRSDDTVWLGEWKLQAGERMLALTDYAFPPRKCLLICYRDMEKLYGEAEHVVGGLSSRTMLLNKGSVLLLYDPDFILVDWMEYCPAMHAGEYYADGDGRLKGSILTGSATAPIIGQQVPDGGEEPPGN